jgi:hypothetical protein
VVARVLGSKFFAAEPPVAASRWEGLTQGRLASQHPPCFLIFRSFYLLLPQFPGWWCRRRGGMADCRGLRGLIRLDLPSPGGLWRDKSAFAGRFGAMSWAGLS